MQRGKWEALVLELLLIDSIYVCMYVMYLNRCTGYGQGIKTTLLLARQGTTNNIGRSYLIA